MEKRDFSWRQRPQIEPGTLKFRTSGSEVHFERAAKYGVA
jgi:hypothetical protein